MLAESEISADEAYADVFCISAEVRAILDRHRAPRDLDDPEFWRSVKQKALADWHSGRVPIWRQTHDDGKQVFFGYENDPAACARRDEFDSAPTTPT